MAVLWLPALAVAGCDAGVGNAGANPGTLAGTVRFDGAGVPPSAPLSLAVYTSFPPAGPPLRAQLVERYTLPYTFAFEALPPGRYWVGALLDIDRMDTRFAGMLNPARDPYGYADDGAPIELRAGKGVAGLEIQLAGRR